MPRGAKPILTADERTELSEMLAAKKALREKLRANWDALNTLRADRRILLAQLHALPTLRAVAASHNVSPNTIKRCEKIYVNRCTRDEQALG